MVFQESHFPYASLETQNFPSTENFTQQVVHYDGDFPENEGESSPMKGGVLL